LKVIPLLQAFSSTLFHIFGALHGPSASAEFHQVVMVWACAAKRKWLGEEMYGV